MKRPVDGQFKNNELKIIWKRSDRDKIEALSRNSFGGDEKTMNIARIADNPTEIRHTSRLCHKRYRLSDLARC
jgi:hypothetical protein